LNIDSGDPQGELTVSHMSVPLDSTTQRVFSD
jgi:hypothetical protein